MIFHIPHAFPDIPPEQGAKILLTDEALSQELLKITDWFTDELFGCHAATRDSLIVFPVSRLVVDPERFLDDTQEPMAKVGMGVVYTKTSAGGTLREPPSAEERARLIDTYYRPHHKRLIGSRGSRYKKRRHSRDFGLPQLSIRAFPYELTKIPIAPISASAQMITTHHHGYWRPWRGSAGPRG